VGRQRLFIWRIPAASASHYLVPVGCTNFFRGWPSLFRDAGLPLGNRFNRPVPRGFVPFSNLKTCSNHLDTGEDDGIGRPTNPRTFASPMRLAFALDDPVFSCKKPGAQNRRPQCPMAGQPAKPQANVVFRRLASPGTYCYGLQKSGPRGFNSKSRDGGRLQKQWSVYDCAGPGLALTISYGRQALLKKTSPSTHIEIERVEQRGMPAIATWAGIFLWENGRRPLGAGSISNIVARKHHGPGQGHDGGGNRQRPEQTHLCRKTGRPPSTRFTCLAQTFPRREPVSIETSSTQLFLTNLNILPVPGFSRTTSGQLADGATIDFESPFLPWAGNVAHHYGHGSNQRGLHRPARLGPNPLAAGVGAIVWQTASSGPLRGPARPWASGDSGNAYIGPRNTNLILGKEIPFRYPSAGSQQKAGVAGCRGT